MSDLIARADAFASRAHAGQKRKYTGDPYIVHPRAVAAIVRTVPHSFVMVAAALLHDVIEDCGVTKDDLLVEFGANVAGLVLELTEQTPRSAGNRALRKAREADRLSHASRPAKTIKLADVIDNTRTIVEHDPKFASIYLAEVDRLLASLAGGDTALYHRARVQVDEALQRVTRRPKVA